MRQSELFFDPQPWPVYIAQEGEEIDFVENVEMKPYMETDRRFRNLGDR